MFSIVQIAAGRMADRCLAASSAAFSFGGGGTVFTHGNTLEGFVQLRAEYLVNTIAGGFLTAMLIFYGFRMIIGTADEGAMTEAKVAYGHAIFGAVLVWGASTLANTVGVTGSVNVEPGLTQTAGLLDKVVAFFIAAVGTALIVNITIQGIRLLVAQEDGAIQNARKQVLYSSIGAAMVLLARAILSPFVSRTNLTGTVGAEIKGIISFLSTLFGALAVVGIIVAGFMIMLSVDEQLKDRGRKLVIASAIAIVVVVSSQGIVTLFLF